MERKDKLTLAVSILALIFSSIAILKDFEEANIEIAVYGSQALLSSPKDTLLKETLTIPILFTNSSNNLGLVRKVSLYKVGYDTLIWRYFTSDYLELYWPKGVNAYTQGVIPQSNIISRNNSRAHPFSVGGQSDAYYSVQFIYDKSFGFFDPQNTYKLFIETSTNSWSTELRFWPENENWKGNGSYLKVY